MSDTYQIHPSIGVARIGNSRDEGGKKSYFLGPEHGDDPDRPRAAYRDPDGSIIRQAARFRVFRVQHEPGRTRVTEVNPRDARIVWTVELANRKGVGRRLERDEEEGRWRNKVVDPADKTATKPYIIKPKPGSVSLKPIRPEGEQAPDQEPPEIHTFVGGHFMGKSVPLGDMFVEEKTGRLIVRGGVGNSHFTGTHGTEPDELNFADNDGYYDDTSDGIVRARLEFTDGKRQPVDAEPAWVIVGPPDFAPEIQNLITLYDLARDIAIDKELWKAPAKPYFDRDIKPLLRRVFDYQWVNKYAAHRHGRGRPYDFVELDFWLRLGDPGADPGLRQRLFERLRDPTPRDLDPKSDEERPVSTAMPRLHDDLGPRPQDERGVREYDPRRVLAFLPFQYKMLEQWCRGNFHGAGVPDPDPPSESLTDKIDRVSMEACVGGPFYPGIETWEIIRDPALWAGGPADPFRLNVQDKRLVPGRLTEGNALPWQSDFLDCRWEDNAGWWPAQRPDHVRVDPDSEEMHDWTHGLEGKDQPTREPTPKDMIRNWDKLGFVLRSQDSEGREVFVEVDRDPNHELRPRPGPKAP